MAEKPKTNKRGLFLMGVGLLLLLGAGITTYVHNVQEKQAGIRSAEALVLLQAKIPGYGQAGNDAVENMLKVFSLDAEESLTIEDAAYIGILEIPSLGLTLPIQSDWSYPNLRLSPCRYRGSAKNSDLIIAGHNYPAHFGYFYRLNIGDKVRFTDVLGNVYDYQVSGLETLESTDVKKMTSGNWDLTLFTCTTGGMTRVTVRCRLAE